MLQTTPSVTFGDAERKALTERIQNAGTEVVEAKAGAGSATLSMAYAAARMAESTLLGLQGEPNMFECAFVDSEVSFGVDGTGSWGAGGVLLEAGRVAGNMGQVFRTEGAVREGRGTELMVAAVDVSPGSEGNWKGRKQPKNSVGVVLLG